MASHTMAGGLVTGSNARNEVNVLHGDEVSPSFISSKTLFCVKVTLRSLSG